MILCKNLGKRRLS